MSAKPIPDGYEAAIPYLAVRKASDAIAFYKKAFSAREVLCIAHDGKIGHAELEIGNAKIMLSDEFPEHEALSPGTIGGTPVVIHLYVPDVDCFTRRAVEEGLHVLRCVKDQFYGDRCGKFEDPFGHRWIIASRQEDLTLEELRARAAALFSDR